MSDGHITRDLLRAWTRGELDQGKLVRFGTDHLMSLCPFCRAEMQAFHREQTGQATSPEEAKQLLALLVQQARQAEKELKQARRELAELLALPPEQRGGKIDRARARFRNPTLATLLLEESKKHIPAEPKTALHFAQLAREAALRGPGAEVVRAGVQALAHAHLANAHRAAGDLQAASRFMELARHNLRYDAVLDLDIRAEVASLEGSLHMDLRFFELAITDLTQSVLFFRLVGRDAEAARSLVQLSYTHYCAGDIAKAIETLEHAMAGLSPEAQPREYSYAQLNLVLYLCETAEYSRARRWLEAAEPLYRSLNDKWTRLRVLWLEARIAAGLGEHEQAENAYRSARAGFIEREHGFDAALVGLDLAMLYLAQHRYPEICQLAAEMLTLFEAQGVHREALAAVLLFDRAAREATLSRALLRSVAKRLEQAKKLPPEAEEAAG